MAGIGFLVVGISGADAFADVAIRDDAKTNPLTDFMIPDICVDDQDRGIPGDPGQCHKHRDLKPGEEIPYVRTQTLHLKDGAPDPATGTISVVYPVADRHLEMTVVTWDDHIEKPSTNTGALDRDVFDVYGVSRWGDASMQTYASAETTGSAGPNAWAGEDCQAQDGWSFFEKTFVPFGSSGITSFTRAARTVPYVAKSQLNLVIPYDLFFLSPLRHDSDGNLYRLNEPVCDRSRKPHVHLIEDWSQRGFVFESEKTLDAIFERYFYNVPEDRPIDKRRIGIEENVFTREYGRTRWEVWKSGNYIEQECKKKDPYNISGCVARFETEGGRCVRRESIHMESHGLDTYRVTCSDRTTVMPTGPGNRIAGLPIQPRVFHLSREIYGANQNWIAYPDFAGGVGLASGEDPSDAAWQPSSEVANYGIARDSFTNNAALSISCRATAPCSVTSSRFLVGGQEGDLPDHHHLTVMTPGERSDLAWLQTVDMGASFSNPNRSDPVGVQLTATFLNESGLIVKSGTVKGTVPPGSKARIKLGGVPFSAADLTASSQMQFTVTVDAAKTVTVDDVYLYPTN